MTKNKNNKYGYNPQQDENERQKQLQESVVLSAYDKQVAQDILYMTMEVFEKYIEKANYYSDWQVRRKIHDNKVTREFSSVEEAESVLSSNLLGLKISVQNKPSFFRDELKQEYYRWVDATGIDINNISPQAERLKHWLLEVNEVLEDRGGRFVKEVAQESRDHVQKMSDEEFARKMNQAFGAWNEPLNKEGERAHSLKGQTYKDVPSSSKFVGADDKKGKEAFSQIAGAVADKHDKFDYYQKTQQSASSSGILLGNPPTNSEIIQDVKQNGKQSWRIDEVITEYNVLGGAKKKEMALVHSSAEVGNDGEVFGNQPVYLAKRFNQAEITEIQQALNISQSSSTSASSSQCFQITPKVSEIRQPQKTNNPISTSGILAIIGAVSVLTIGSVVVAKKQLKKSKK